MCRVRNIPPPPPAPLFRSLGELRLGDLESIRLILRGSSVIDWARMALHTEEEVREFLAVHEFDLGDPASRARAEAIKNSAIAYLKRNFDFPIPKPVAAMGVEELILLAGTRGHRQLCACTILNVVHIIHHLAGRELLFMLPISDQDVFSLVEEKVYRVIGGHAYGGVYPGPVGSVFEPARDRALGPSPLPHASSLCGACREVCPVRIDR